MSEPTTTQLTAARAVRLVDAALSHLRTSLETCDDEARAQVLRDAIEQVACAQQAVHRLDGPVRGA